MSKEIGMTFEDFLREKHAVDYRGTDDDMPDAFDQWLYVNSDNLIDLATEWHSQEMAKAVPSVESIESIIEKVMFAHHSDISMTDDANIHDAAWKIRALCEGKGGEK